MSARIEYLVRSQVQEIEQALLLVLKRAHARLTQISAERTGASAMIDAVFEGKEPKGKSDEIALPKRILSFEPQASTAVATRDEIVRVDKVQRRHWWYWLGVFKRTELVQVHESVAYVRVEMPTIGGLTSTLGAAVTGAVDRARGNLLAWAVTVVSLYKARVNESLEAVQKLLANHLNSMMTRVRDQIEDELESWRHAERHIERIADVQRQLKSEILHGET